MLAQWVAVAAAVWVAAQPAGADETPLATVLARAATYVAEFHRQLSSIVAEEQYVQTVYAAKIESAGTWPSRRVLKSDLLLLKPAGAESRFHENRVDQIGQVAVAELDRRKVDGDLDRIGP